MASSIETLLFIVGSSGVTAAAVAGLVVWLWKTWISEKIRGQIQHEYSMQLEMLKNKLKAEADVEIEKLRSQLSIAAAERQVRFTRLHEKRADVVAEVYAALRAALFAMANYVKFTEWAGEPSRKERGQEAADKANAFRSLYHTKRIFIPKDTATKIDSVDLEIVRSYNVFQFMVDQLSAANKHDMEAWRQAYETIDRLSKIALDELEIDFRRLLGEEVASEPPSKS
jgi:hypothetical protein